MDQRYYKELLFDAKMRAYCGFSDALTHWFSPSCEDTKEAIPPTVAIPPPILEPRRNLRNATGNASFPDSSSLSHGDHMAKRQETPAPFQPFKGVTSDEDKLTHIIEEFRAGAGWWWKTPAGAKEVVTRRLSELNAQKAEVEKGQGSGSSEVCKSSTPFLGDCITERLTWTIQEVDAKIAEATKALAMVQGRMKYMEELEKHEA